MTRERERKHIQLQGFTGLLQMVLSEERFGLAEKSLGNGIYQEEGLSPRILLWFGGRKWRPELPLPQVLISWLFDFLVTGQGCQRESDSKSGRISCMTPG